jgi:DNA-binding cell septation regulator SpoVG
MEITKVKIIPYCDKLSSIVAFADIVLDDSFKIRGILICKDRLSNNLKLIFPNKKMRNKTFKGIAFPTNTNTHNKVFMVIINEYRKLL